MSCEDKINTSIMLLQTFRIMRSIAIEISNEKDKERLKKRMMNKFFIDDDQFNKLLNPSTSFNEYVKPLKLYYKKVFDIDLDI